jgi:hypothetical protein
MLLDIIICLETAKWMNQKSQSDLEPVEFPKFCKIFQNSPSHRIFGRMHEALHIDKKIKLITQFRRNSRDESFKPN